MRKLLVAALLCLTPFPAIAANEALPTETVTVNGSTLTGVWKIAMPNYVQKSGLFSALKWGPLRDHFCRIGLQQDGLAINCLLGERDGTVEIEGTHIHIAWGMMLARMVLNGTLQSPGQFDGINEAKLAGLSFADPDTSSGTKLEISAGAPDKGEKSALLRTLLNGGMAQIPHDDAAIRKAAPASGEIPRLGAIQAIAYLGQQTKFGGPDAHEDQIDFFSVYAVEFDRGERICGLHQRSDSVLDGFICL